MSIRRLTLTGLAVLGVAGAGPMLSGAPALAFPGYVPLAPLTGTPSGPFGFALSVAADDSAGNVYVGDSGVSPSVVDEFKPSGEYVSQLSPGGGEFFPFSVAVNNSTGDVYVNNGGGLVDVFNAAGVYQPQLTLTGASGGVAINQSTGEVYVVDEGVVNVFNAAGEPVSHITGPAGGSFGSAQGVAVSDSTGDVYVADSDASVVDVFNSAGAYISQLTGTSSGAFSPNGIYDVAVDNSTNPVTRGDVYVADSAASVVDVFSPAGVYLTQLPLSVSCQTVGAVTVDQANGDVYALNCNGGLDGFAPILFASATTGLASNVQGTSATVAGSVNPESESIAAFYHVEYGPSISYGSRRSVPGPSTGIASTQVTKNLTGLTPNTTYHYRLTAENENGTINGEDRTFITPPVAPTVTDQPAQASYVTPFEATLQGTINPEHDITSYHFAYGLSSAYEASVPIPAGYTPNNYQDDTVTQTLTGLRPGTTYHFALVATDSAGITTGPDETFTTPPAPPPTVSTGAAGEVTQSTATISGTLDPQGLQSAYQFDLGTSTDYETLVFGTASPEQGSQTLTVSFQSLMPATTYHYRLVATSEAGTSYGADQTFTTPGVPSPIAAPIAAPLIATPAIAFPTGSQANTGSTETKRLTNAQKLANALKACRKDEKQSKRAKCEKQARGKYGSSKKKKK